MYSVATGGIEIFAPMEKDNQSEDPNLRSKEERLEEKKLTGVDKGWI